MLFVEKERVRKKRRRMVQVKNILGALFVLMIFLLARNIRLVIHMDKRIRGVLRGSRMEDWRILVAVVGQ